MKKKMDMHQIILGLFVFLFLILLVGLIDNEQAYALPGGTISIDHDCAIICTADNQVYSVEPGVTVSVFDPNGFTGCKIVTIYSGAVVKKNKGQIDIVGLDSSVLVNYGTIGNNKGTNYENYGHIALNERSVYVNASEGTIGRVNGGRVYINQGSIDESINYSMVLRNESSGTINYNDARVYFNEGTVSQNHGEVYNNSGQVINVGTLHVVLSTPPAMNPALSDYNSLISTWATTSSYTIDINHTVSFDLNGVDGCIPDSMIVSHGQRVTGPVEVDTPADYCFGGWYKEPACINEWVFDTDVVIDDTVLYAKWISIESGNPSYLDKLYLLLDETVKSGGKQVIRWNEGTSLPYDVMKTLESNPDITLIFSYTYEDVDYEVTLSGKNVKAYEDILWYGPLYLELYYGSQGRMQTTTSGGEYSVKKGDTLFKIARELGTSVKQLVTMNNLSNPNYIIVGQILFY